MKAHLFSHPRFSSHPAAHLSISIVRSLSALRVSFELHGNLAAVFLPEQSKMPARKDGLWQTTCFEFFFAPPISSRYWEVNLSPSKDWNVYTFDAYRTGMREEQAIAELPFTVQQQTNALQVELDFPLARIIRPEQSIDVAVSAVIQDSCGQRSFWALTHCGLEPDFHQRASFTLHLPGC